MFSKETAAAQPGVLSSPRHPSKNTSVSNLNPFASEFIPLTSFIPSYDAVDAKLDAMDDSFDFQDVDTSNRIDDIFLQESLWLNFQNSDDTADPYDPCSCHQLPRGSCPEYKEYHVNRIARGLLQTGLTPNMDGLREPLKFPSFPLDVWRKALEGYFDGEEINNAFTYGWDLSFTERPTPRDAKCNLQGASLFQNDVQKYIDQELKFGALVGPFKQGELPFQTFCSPLNTVPKKNSDVRRTVVDCTQLGTGVNTFIDAHLHRGQYWKLSLPNSQSVISRIQRARRRYPGQRILIFKLDFQRWYRWFVLDPVASIYLAIRWRGHIYLDTALSFGNRGAALAAQRVIWAIVYLFRTKVPPFPGSFNLGISCSCPHHCECGENDAEGYIDDFLAFVPECLAQFQYDAALKLAKSLGLRISQTPGHVSPPNAICECLGILYNTDNNTMELPQDKVQDLTNLLTLWLSKRRATEHELAVLCGKLLYCSNVIFAGRLFLNRCLATKRFASRLSQPAVLTEEFFLDIKWWLEAIKQRNGISFLVPTAESHVSLDASSNGWLQDKPGLGGFNHSIGEYFSCTVPEQIAMWCIADLELVAHVVAVHLWAPAWNKQQVVIHTDNQACYWLLTKGRSRDDRRLCMSRWLCMEQIRKDFRFSSAWISTTENTVADSLSRWGQPGQEQIFKDCCKGLAKTPTRRHVNDSHFDFNLTFL